MKRSSRYWLLTLLLACGDGSLDRKGSVEVRITGQAFAREGWPVTIDGETTAFDDGWSVRFERVLVCVAAFRVAEGGDEVISGDPVSYLVDLQKGEFPLWQLHDVKAQRWREVGYQFVTPSSETVVLGSTPPELLTTMQAEGHSLWIQGTGERDGRRVRFDFGIPGEVMTTDCRNGHDESDGMIVGEGRTTQVELTLHMDHLFWDDHDAETPRLLFGPLAYAAGDDDVVTLDELAAQRLADLKDANGEPLVDAEDTPIVYVPRVELPENDLREYLIDTALTLGHFNGEGHCAYEVRR